MTALAPIAESRLGQYLPTLYRQDDLLSSLLCTFEKILLGREDGIEYFDIKGLPENGLEEKIASLATYFEPATAREDFLSWLAQWLAVSLRADLDDKQIRKLLSSIVELYCKRGTRGNLQRLLSFFTLGQPTVIDNAEGLQIGKHSTIGKDTFVGAPAHVFTVVLVWSIWRPVEVQRRQFAITRAVIEAEKPAHTAYNLVFRFPSMRIGFHSSVGVDTLLGTATEETENDRRV